MIVSILLTLIVSSSFAAIGFFTGGDIYRWFFVSFVSQFILFFIINNTTFWLWTQQKKCIILKAERVIED